MIVLDSKLEMPLYRQIYQQLRDEILSGELKCGEKMPSTRKLSRDLNVSRNTIEWAYHQLKSEGYLVSKHRSGYFVEGFDFAGIHVAKSQKDDSGIEPFIEYDKSLKYDFRYGKLSTDHLPIRQWQRLTNKCIREHQERLSFYGPTFGEIELREEILNYLKYYRGVNCSVDQIFIGAGVHYCLGMLSQLLGKHMTSIAMEDPGYHITRSTLKNHGFEVEPIALDAQGVDVKELYKLDVGAVYVTPSHQYPLGIIMPISRRLELIEWAQKKDALIIEDDYSCHLRYNVNPVQSLQSISNERVIYIGSFSKFLFPTLRVAYMVVPRPILDEFRRMFEGYPSSVSFQIQKTLELFMKEGHWESFLRRNCKLQKKKHDTLVEALYQKMGDKITIYGKNAGLHLLIEVRNGMNEGELIKRAHEWGVKVYPTKNFWQNPKKNTHGVVLGFGGIDMEAIEPAVESLAKAWDSE